MSVRGLILLAVLALRDPVDDLIARLGSDDYAERVQATAALQALGKPVEARLRALRTADAEVAWRRDVILEHLKTLHETELLFSRVRVGVDRCEVIHGEAEDGQSEEAGFRGRIPFGGRVPPRPALYPWGRIVRLGVRGNTEEFVCVQRRVSWREHDPAALLPVLRAELARAFELGVPDAFQLLARAPLFPELVPALEERLKNSSDPVVREACRRALEGQRRMP